MSKPISLALQNFHFGVETLNDAVIAGEGPHAGDFLTPGIQCSAELCEWREPATTEGGHQAEEAVSQLLALFGSAMFLQQQLLRKRHREIRLHW